jgi:hypothetical protein
MWFFWPEVSSLANLVLGFSTQPQSYNYELPVIFSNEPRVDSVNYHGVVPGMFRFLCSSLSVAQWNCNLKA